MAALPPARPVAEEEEEATEPLRSKIIHRSRAGLPTAALLPLLLLAVGVDEAVVAEDPAEANHLRLNLSLHSNNRPRAGGGRTTPGGATVGDGVEIQGRDPRTVAEEIPEGGGMVPDVVGVRRRTVGTPSTVHVAAASVPRHPEPTHTHWTTRKASSPAPSKRE